MGKQPGQPRAKESSKDAADQKLNRAIGDVLRVHRTAKKLTQQDLGIASGTDSVYISRIESGRHSPTVATLFKLADSLGIQPSDFIKEVSARLASLPNHEA
jgi:transcriptional regulator with XRE-family HTH domain